MFFRRELFYPLNYYPKVKTTYINCTNCNTKILRKRTGTSKSGEAMYTKFCNRSCSATHNNTVSPKRKVEGICKSCKTPCHSYNVYCKDCWDDTPIDWSKVTKGKMMDEGNANYGKWPYIRGLSRKKYLVSDKPKECVCCGYSLHFDVAHIISCESFPDTATIAEINHIDNLTALCKNHHWEYDHGYRTALSTELQRLALGQ